MKKRFLAIILCITMILSLVSCGGPADPQIQSKNLMLELETSKTGKENPEGKTEPIFNKEEDMHTAPTDTLADYEDQYPLSDFGVRLMQQTMKNAGTDENVLISPLSVLLAMYMTANGADGVSYPTL